MDSDLLFNLRKFLAPEIVYGEGALELAGRHAANFGATKVLIVTDPGVEDAGWSVMVEESMKEASIPYVVFNEVTPNPKDYEVKTGARIYRDEGCDLIVAVGGGSPMDCAKGIGVLAGNSGKITDYEGIDEVPEPGPPLIFIPTTAGSSADVSQFAIITDTSRNVKIAIVSKMVIPDIALVDPVTTITMPPELTAATGMDTLCHAFEAFVSTSSSPITDMAAISSISLTVDNLVAAYGNPSDMKYRNNMMMASLMAGLAFSNASLGLVHAMAHSLGGAFGLPHGECNALLLEKVIRYNYRSAAAKYDLIAGAMGIEIEGMDISDRADILSDNVASLRKRLGIDHGLSEMGVSLSDIPRLAGFAFQDACLATNPRIADPEDIADLYREIY